MRRYGERPDPAQRYTTRPGAYAVIRGEDGWLMTLEDGPFAPEPEIQLPGGGIDPGESPVQALHREVMEETGWRIAVERRLGAYQRYVYMPEYDLWARKVCHIFLARPTLRIGAPLEDNHDVFWTSPAAALTLLTSTADREFLSVRRDLD